MTSHLAHTEDVTWVCFNSRSVPIKSPSCSHSSVYSGRVVGNFFGCVVLRQSTAHTLIRWLQPYLPMVTVTVMVSKTERAQKLNTKHGNFSKKKMKLRRQQNLRMQMQANFKKLKRKVQKLNKEQTGNTKGCTSRTGTETQDQGAETDKLTKNTQTDAHKGENNKHKHKVKLMGNQREHESQQRQATTTET